MDKLDPTHLTDQEIIDLYWQGMTIAALAKRVKYTNDHKSLGGARAKVERVIYDELMKKDSDGKG